MAELIPDKSVFDGGSFNYKVMKNALGYHPGPVMPTTADIAP